MFRGLLQGLIKGDTGSLDYSSYRDFRGIQGKHVVVEKKVEAKIWSSRFGLASGCLCACYGLGGFRVSVF